MTGGRAEFVVGPPQAGERLDRALAALAGVARAQAQRWIEDERVRVNGALARASLKLAEGDRVLADPPEAAPSVLAAEPIALTLLQLATQHRYAVIEMGMNHAGEISKLVQIAEPDIVVCTMVGRSHIEFFGTVEKIAAAKEEIYETASAKATRIYNLDDKMTVKMYEKALKKFNQSPVLTFSSQNAVADVHFKIENFSLKELHIKGFISGESGEARVPVFGKHNLTNLLAAATLSLAAGLDPQEIWQGLTKCKTNWGRNQWLETKHGVQILFDAYNANPDSMKALLNNLEGIKIAGKKIGVFGQMGELGNLSKELHEQLGEMIGQSDMNEVFFYGADCEAFKAGIKRTNSAMKLMAQGSYSEDLGKKLKSLAVNGDLVIVKGSRSAKMEKIILPLEPIGFSEKY